ncbi:MAG: hypothetical protein ACW99U_20210 [Candidatus Thorarchaeota archaeon]|jgi:hypothetical protein
MIQNQSNQLPIGASGISGSPGAFWANTAASGIFTTSPMISGFQMEEPGPEPEVVEEYATPSYAEEDCAHGFLVTDRDNKGNIYWCKICDKRFPTHPVPEGTDTSQSLFDVEETVGKFREGVITLQEAASRCTYSADELKEAVQLLFPPTETKEEIFLLGQPHVRSITVSQDPQRTTGYQELEDEIHSRIRFGFEEQTAAELTVQTFDDIESVDMRKDIATESHIFEFNFVDGSVQRVVITEKELRDIDANRETVTASFNLSPQTVWCNEGMTATEAAVMNEKIKVEAARLAQEMDDRLLLGLTMESKEVL